MQGEADQKASQLDPLEEHHPKEMWACESVRPTTQGTTCCVLWWAVEQGDSLPRPGIRRIGSARSARTIIMAGAGGVIGALAPPTIGVADVATSIEAIANFAIGEYVACLGHSATID